MPFVVAHPTADAARGCAESNPMDGVQSGKAPATSDIVSRRLTYHHTTMIEGMNNHGKDRNTRWQAL